VKFYPSTIGELPRIMKKLDYQLNTAGIGALQNFMDMEINFCQHFKLGDCTTLGGQQILHKQVIDRIFLGHNV